MSQIYDPEKPGKHIFEIDWVATYSGDWGAERVRADSEDEARKLFRRCNTYSRQIERITLIK